MAPCGALCCTRPARRWRLSKATAWSSLATSISATVKWQPKDWMNVGRVLGLWTEPRTTVPSRGPRQTISWALRGTIASSSTRAQRLARMMMSQHSVWPRLTAGGSDHKGVACAYEVRLAADRGRAASTGAGPPNLRGVRGIAGCTGIARRPLHSESCAKAEVRGSFAGAAPLSYCGKHFEKPRVKSTARL